ELLLSKGADVNAQGERYGSALYAASYGGHNKTVELLLSKGADVNAQDGWYGTALCAASTEGRVKTVELLLQKGADANVQGGRYGNAHNGAAFNGRTELLRLLLTGNRAGQDLRDDQGRSALHLAARGGHISTMDSLLALGMDINVKDMRGDQILSYAASGASALTVQRILQHPSLCVEESDGWSPLHWACRIGDAEVLRLLIDKGFQGHVVRTSYPQALWTPYSIAIFHGNRKLLSELGNWRSDLFTCEHTLSEATQIFAEKVSTKVAEKVPGVICDSCEHDIYGPRFHCVICPDFDYCFMCKLTADKSHPGHEWEKTET
ncbi:ankyrin repeat protein, partial [Cenococcum geophilum]